MSEGSKEADTYFQVPCVELIKLKFIAKGVPAEPGVLAYSEIVVSHQLPVLNCTSCQVD